MSKIISETTYVIGDVHGCFYSLIDLLKKILKHSDGRSFRLVFLGDYVDRGPESAAVVRLLRQVQERTPERVICLKGNHEDMLVRAYLGLIAPQMWSQMGGSATLSSFGIASPNEIPIEIAKWLLRLPTFYEDTRRYYVHAGFRPGASFFKQERKMHLWIRDEFLQNDYDFGKLVVHGHTPVWDFAPDVRRYRVNLDTGCVYGGKLTAGIFADDQDAPIGFLQSDLL